MNYTIDIIDTLNDSHTTLLEYAEASSIVLNWQGADNKATQSIVGSFLNFTLEVNIADSKDAYFVDLLTGDELRYKVRLYIPSEVEANEVTVWSGFLLPDAYDEPYTNETFYVLFEATDGLGRLRGKYLPDEFYESEKNVILFIAECLKLTGLAFEIHFAAAIVNKIEPEYHNIFIDGAEFESLGTKKDAHAILTEILKSMLCEVYQAEDHWVVEGYNQRHVSKVAYKIYSFEGVYLDFRKDLRLVKNFNPLDKPIISTIVPLGEIVVTHERRPQALPETIAVEKNDGWAIGQGVTGDIFPTYWFANGGYLPKAIAPDYKVALPTNNAQGFSSVYYISLKDKLYVKQFDKLVFSGKFKSEVPARQDNATTYNGMRLAFMLNDVEAYKVDKSFESDELHFQFDLYADEDGLLDLWIYQPYFGGSIGDGTYAQHIFIEELKLEVIAFEPTETFRSTINEEFTTRKEIALPFSDDASGFSKGFRLAKLKEQSSEYNEIDVPVLYTFAQNGKHYAVVSLYGANLAADNLDTIYEGATQLQNVATAYNHQNGEQMVIETENEVLAANLTIRRYTTNDVEGSRKGWEQWGDAAYDVENDRYAESVAKVFRRLFPVAHERIQFTSDAAFKYNDLIAFNYVLPRHYVPVNISWNVDRGETSGVMVRAMYQNNIVDVGGDALGPVVDAGQDVLLPANFGTFQAGSYTHTTAQAFDPDGFIVGYQWTIESGDPLAFFTRAQDLTPRLVSFAGDELVLRLTVTDSDGLTGTDTVKFSRHSETTASLTNQLDFISNALDTKKDLFVLAPALAANYSLKLKGKVTLDVTYQGNLSNTLVILSVLKNGIVINKQTFQVELGPNEEYHEAFNFEVNYIDGDQISFEHSIQKLGFFLSDPNAYVHRTAFEIYSIQFNQGNGNVLGLPVISEKLMTPGE